MLKFRYYNRKDLPDIDMLTEVKHYLLRKNHRYMTNEELIRRTGISEEKLYSWIRMGKISNKLFPNLGLPCEKCSEPTTNNNYCNNCLDKLKRELRNL